MEIATSGFALVNVTNLLGQMTVPLIVPPA